MDRILSDLTYNSLLVYLDDILVFGATFDETLERMSQLLTRIRSAYL
jgi:hypothetical protein